MEGERFTLTETILTDIARVESDITPFPRLGFLKPIFLVVIALVLAGLCFFVAIASIGAQSQKEYRYRQEQKLQFPWGR